MKFNKVKKPMFLLNFNEEMPTVDFKINLPLLIDDKDNVILGNSMRKQFDVVEDIDCVEIKYDKYLIEPLQEIERALILDNEKHDIKRVEKGIKKYLSSFKEVEVMRLFELPVDEGFVTEENFKKPPSYNFDKGKKDKGGDEDAGLFGGFGDR